MLLLHIVAADDYISELIYLFCTTINCIPELSMQRDKYQLDGSKSHPRHYGNNLGGTRNVLAERLTVKTKQH
ncbi:hypothetical protein PILCRDRAFT_809906, partial [Piloderma croceum F 1598]